MDRSEDIRQSGSFLCKKWTLFTFSAIGIVFMIIMASIASKLIDSYDTTYSREDLRAFKDAALILIWIFSGLTILFFLVGLMAAYKENYCMTVTYAVLITLSALGSISAATKNPYYWFETVFLFISCGVTYAFAYDLRRIRLMQFSAPSMVVISGGAPVIHVSPGQYAPGQYDPSQAYATTQFNNQYGQPSGAQVQSNWNSPAYAAPENKVNY